MHRNNRPGLFILILVLAIIAGSCKTSSGNSNKSMPPAQAKLARWVQQYRSPSSQGLDGNQLTELFFYSSISVLSPNLVYVAGDMRNPKNKDDRIGVVVKTTDGGQTWNETFLEQSGVADIRINGMSFSDENNGCAVGRVLGGDGILFKTADGGKTWAFSKIPGFKQVPTCIFMADPMTWWVGGSTSANTHPKDPTDSADDYDDEPGGPSDLLVTKDGGKTWQSQIRLSCSLYDIQFLDPSNGWVSGSRGSIYHTSNGGITWDRQHTEIEPGEPLNIPGTEGAKMFHIMGICFLDADHGYAAARANDEDTGRILGTSNGGATWARQRIVADSGARDILFVSPDEGWIITDKGQYIYHTLDGNKSWLSEKKDVESDPLMVRLGAADAKHVWAVGGGMILVRQSE